MSNSKKPNQHLENLIKADGYHALPLWYQTFVHKLMMLGQSDRAIVLDERMRDLESYLDNLVEVDQIRMSVFNNLWLLVVNGYRFTRDSFVVYRVD